mmetsp:Transcript_106784/g.297222  ORF Transcript_106784/g.297222 Transcript_106784/m.297222 type:complete len:435 (+) Transcript_106784:129-1433(+)
MQTSQAQRRRRQLRKMPSGTSDPVQALTPSHPEPGEGPSTPGVPGPVLGPASPEIGMLYPQPQRAFAVASPEHPRSPGHGVDEASRELRELLDGTKGGRQSPFDGNRPLSSVSTSAGPTPGPDERTSPANGHSPNANTPPGHSERTAQVRKVFVGGVPQDLEQDDLYTIFSEFGGVKKAWLQRYRATSNGGSNPTHNHRGFGFIIFYDGSAVEQLLGKNFSRFINLKDGRRLEVKRAVSSSDMLNNQTSTAASSPQQVQQSPAPVAPTWPAGHTQITQSPWSPDPRAGPWLGHLPPQQGTVMASPVPWPGSVDGGAPAVLPPTMLPTYSAVPSMQLPGSGSPRPPTMLFSPGAGLAPVAHGGGSRIQPAGAPMAMGPAPTPGVMAAIPPHATMQQVLATAAGGGVLPWPQAGNLAYSGMVVPDASFLQPTPQYF